MTNQMDEQTRLALEQIAELAKGGNDTLGRIYQITRRALGEILTLDQIKERLAERAYWRMRHTYARDLQTVWNAIVETAREDYRYCPEAYEWVKQAADVDLDAIATQVIERLPTVPTIAYHFQHGQKIRTLDELMDWMKKPGVYAISGGGTPHLRVPHFDNGTRTGDIYKTAWSAAQRRGLIVTDGQDGYYTRWIAKKDETDGN